MIRKLMVLAGALSLCVPVSAQDKPPSASSTSPASSSASPSVPAPQPDAAPETQPTSAPALPPDSKFLEPTKIVKALYPLGAEKDELQGEVVIKFVVSETGDVERAEVVSGNPVLAGAALDAAKKWKFKPFIRGGKPVKAATQIPFDFAFANKVTDVKIKGTLTPPVQSSGAPGANSPDLPKEIRVSQGVIAGMLVHKVVPVYPPEAKRARVQGAVILAAIIGKDGTIKSLHVLSGPPTLVDAAIGAVQQWRYRPYLLLREPVEVDTQITVNFTLRPF
jgi:TonB family protein